MSNEKQIRMTLQDCLFFQDKLRELLKIVISENRPLTHTEKTKIYEIIPKALLSQGSNDPVYFVKENGWFIFSSLQNMIHRTLELHTDKVLLITSRPEKVEITISIGELWKFIFDKVLFLFPLANSEAIHISAESHERPQQGAFDFTSKEVMKVDR